ncbi:SRPBCC family protein [Asticcacaulis sp.]|uniref:SRPBCC family protein n=1 Tax=Asticcacaulis sp. TaxID=1872648 RepID=UPI002BE1EFFC|nr:SRPBCC family protein [Asticcacaulis sp.]HTM80647.1 SRPBCC family protein [Asticcacaulis sp.]
MQNEIRKEIILKAPLEKVWAAISHADEFGQWFGVRFDGPFKASEKLRGVIVPTAVNDEIAAMQKPYEGTPFEIVVGEITPQTRFSFHWHPYGVEKDFDYSQEPMTLCTFVLSEVVEGVRLMITESGFEHIPLERRAKAFTANDGGWEAQTRLIEAYLAF